MTGYSKSVQRVGSPEGTGHSTEFTCTRGTRYALNRTFIWTVLTTPWMLIPLAPLILLVGSIMWANIHEPKTAAGVGVLIFFVVGVYFCTNYFLGFSLLGFGETMNHLSRFEYASAGNVLRSDHDDTTFAFELPGLQRQAFR